MADIENQQDSSFPMKRKSDVFYQDQDNVSEKAQKLNPSSNSCDREFKDGETNGSGVKSLNSSIDGEKLNPEAKDGESNGSGLENLNSSSTGAKVGAESSVENGDLGAEEDQRVRDDEDEGNRNGQRISREDKGKGKLIEMDESEDEEEEEEEVIRNGVGFSREDKGKGKLIEVDASDDEDDDSDDEDDDCFEEDDESEFSDDPLAEVDLDNILPSRTRRRSSQPGVYISNEVCNDEDDDSSDDSDAS